MPVPEWVPKDAICDQCHGTGEVEWQGEMVECPDCLGQGYIDLKL